MCKIHASWPDSLIVVMFTCGAQLMHMGLLPLPAGLLGKRRRHTLPEPQQKGSCFHAMAEALSQVIESC